MTNVQHTFTDPRRSSGFDPSLMPFCDGASAPPEETTDLNERRMVQFASLYCAMNGALQAVDKGRNNGNSLLENLAKELLSSLSKTRDLLEDEVAKSGFLADPVMVDGRYIDIRFTWPGRKSSAPFHAQNFSATIEL